MAAEKEKRTVVELLHHGTGLLQSAGIAEGRIDAELMLGFCLEKNRTYLYLAADQEVEIQAAERYLQMIERRTRREPLAYITGEREFWSKNFHVSPAVLIPRPETEFLIETVLARSGPESAESLCLDLCCGSGIIAVIIAEEMQRQVIAVDISAAAIEVAARNIARHHVSSKVSLVLADLVSCFLPGQRFSLVVSNPPYVRRKEIREDLEPEVAAHEPHLALDGGESGLDVITMIRDNLPEILAPGGDCFIEIGDGQGREVRSLFLDHENGSSFRFAEIYNDYSGRERVAHIRKV